MNETAWTALAAALTVIGLIWTVVAYRRRGLGTGMRAFGFTLLPAAAWLSGTLELATDIGTAVLDWLPGFVLTTKSWAGIGLAGLAVLCLLIGGVLRDRQLARGQRDTAAPGLGSGRVPNSSTRQLSASRPPSESVVSAPGSSPSRATQPADGDTEIEEILRRRGIS